MGRLAVRQAVQSALQSAGLTYVGTVFPARPVIATETDYVQTMTGQAIEESSNGSACILVVNIPSDRRTRYGDVGRATVADWNIHTIAVELFFASPAGDGVAAQEDYDAVVDSLVTYVRSDPTLTAPATIWSAGEYTYGVQHDQEQPFTSEDGLTVLINGVVRFEAWEQDVGAAGTV